MEEVQDVYTLHSIFCMSAGFVDRVDELLSVCAVKSRVGLAADISTHYLKPTCVIKVYNTSVSDAVPQQCFNPTFFFCTINILLNLIYSQLLLVLIVIDYPETLYGGLQGKGKINSNIDAVWNIEFQKQSVFHAHAAPTCCTLVLFIQDWQQWL